MHHFRRIALAGKMKNPEYLFETQFFMIFPNNKKKKILMSAEILKWIGCPGK